MHAGMVGSNAGRKRPRKNGKSAIAAWLLLPCLAVGCNRSGLDLAWVEGVVTLDGAPVADAVVLFRPDDGPYAMGMTDAEGKFTLVTANQPGALVGEHRVAISKDETIAIPQRRGFPLYQTKSLIPERFGNVAESGLMATVNKKRNHFEFPLTSR